MRYLAVLGLILSAPILGSGVPKPASPRLLALTQANVLDWDHKGVRRDATIILDGRYIRAVHSGRSALPDGARIIDLKGAWVLPGLIDAHVHFRDDESARRALRAGVTTARSLGVNGFVDVRMAQRHLGGDKGLPEVIAAGYHVRPQLAEAFFEDFPSLRPLTTGLSGAHSVREAVRANASREVKFIKVMATHRAGDPDTDFRQRALTDVESAAAVSEAGRHGLQVAAHSHTDGGARAAVLAGVRTVEHGTQLSRATLRLMRARSVCLVPTLSFWADMADPGGEYDHPELAARARAMLPKAKLTAANAHRSKVKIAAGSDMRYDGISPFTIADELILLHQSGLSALSAIRAATSDSAICLGIGKRTGSLAPGMEADLLVLDRDPTKDLSALKKPRMVINDGTITQP